MDRCRVPTTPDVSTRGKSTVFHCSKLHFSRQPNLVKPEHSWPLCNTIHRPGHHFPKSPTFTSLCNISSPMRTALSDTGSPAEAPSLFGLCNIGSPKMKQ